MQAVEQAFIDFFERVATKDPVLLETLNQESSFGFKHGCWTFTLPALHLFLQRHQSATFTALKYKQFRKLVFNSSINQAIKLHGAEIIIACNRGKVDESEYALVWRENE